MGAARLRAQNFLPTEYQVVRTATASATNAADVLLPVQSTSGFNATAFRLIGDIGNEQAEIVRGLSQTATSITLATGMSYPHPSGTPVYEVEYDQVRFYRKRSGVESLIAAVPIQAGGKFTIYLDAAAISGDTFASSWYNSYTGDETDKGDYVAVNVYDGNTKRGLVVRAMELFDDLAEEKVKAHMWEDWLNEGYGELQRAMVKKNKGYSLVGPVTLTGTDLSDGSGTSIDTPSDFRELKSLWVTYGSTQSEAHDEEINWAGPNDDRSEYNPSYSLVADTLVIRPAQVTSVALRYYSKLVRLINDSDKPLSPVDDYDGLLLDYMLMRAGQNRKNWDMVKDYRGEYLRKKQLFMAEIGERQAERAQKMRITDQRFLQTMDSHDYI